MDKPLFDLMDLDTSRLANEGVEVQLLHPTTREPLPAFITIRGMDSDAFQVIDMRLADARLKNLRRGQVQTAQERQHERCMVLASVTIGWRGVSLDGAELDFSVANAEKVYNRFKWITEQLDEAVADRARFLKS
jgi:hypothetical protein